MYETERKLNLGSGVRNFTRLGSTSYLGSYIRVRQLAEIRPSVRGWTRVGVWLTGFT